MEINSPTPLRTAKWLAAIVIVMAPACSSSSSSPGTAGDGGTHAGGTTSSSAGGGATSSSAGASGATHTGGASSSGSGGRPGVDGGGQASAACVTYCDCMATNCADKAFPGGCLAQCAAQASWDLACRQNMCTLAPLQPANDHCTHAFGVNECLDK